jgi:ABC-2 type transport system permease protein
MRAVFKRDLCSLYTTPQGYVFSGAFVLVMNIFFRFANIAGFRSDLDAVFAFMLVVLVFTIPVLTMRGFSEEYRRGTDRLLFTAPVKLGSIVSGKFWAIMAAFGGTLFVMTLAYVYIIILFGTLNFAEYLGHMIAILTFAAVYIAIGLFISALTSSQMISMLATLGVFTSLLLLDIASDVMADSAAKRFLTPFSLFKRYDTFARGIFSVTDLVFVATCCIFFLLMTTLVLHRRRHGMRGRRLQLAAFVFPALAVLVLVNLLCGALSERFYFKYDMTRARIFALSSQTVTILNELPEPVTITVLSSREDMNAVVTDEITGVFFHLADVRDCLEKYRATANHNLRLQYIDPDLNPGWIRERDLTDQAGYYSIIVESDRRAKVLSIRDLFETHALFDIDGTIINESLVGLRAEQVITSAIISVITEVLPKAVILNGHGEYPTEYLKWLLTVCNYEIVEINLITQEIPDQTNLLILAAPMHDFNERELNKLDRYLSGGGNAIIAFDPAMPELRALELYLTEWGARFEHAFVFDSVLNYGRQDFILPILRTDNLLDIPVVGGRYLLTFGSRPLTPLWETSGNRVITPFITTYDTAYAKVFDADTLITSLDETDGDLPGPFILGAVCEQFRADGSGNMVVFLPLSVIVDEALSTPGFLNYPLIISLLSQMQPELNLDIPPRDLTTVPLAINSQEVFSLSVVILVVIPLMPVVAGVGMWLVRRRL